jgi:hypothetical protein
MLLSNLRLTLGSTGEVFLGCCIEMVSLAIAAQVCDICCEGATYKLGLRNESQVAFIESKR